MINNYYRDYTIIDNILLYYYTIIILYRKIYYNIRVSIYYG